MQTIVNFVFNNIGFIIIIIAAWYIYVEQKSLKEKTAIINDLFTKTLNKYLETKINEAKEIANSILVEYGSNEQVAAEINRLNTIIEKGITGSINEKVETSNALNKFQVSKKINKEKFPRLAELENIGTFNEEDMESLDNGIAIARREYNAQVFRYNEKAGGVPLQYLVKIFKLSPNYIIFDAPKSSNYEINYEVFEEEEPEINSLKTLNRSVMDDISLNDLLTKKEKKELPAKAIVEESDILSAPTVNLKERKESDDRDLDI